MADELQLWAEMGRRIVLAPDDDRPRREFALRLEAAETGEPNLARTRFIRLQLRLASVEPEHPDWMRLATEAHGLLLDHQEQWTPEFYRSLGIRRPEFFRGFVEGITVPAEILLERSDDIFTAAPIRHLDIVDLPNGWSRNGFWREMFLRSPYFPKLLSLRVDGQELEDEDIEILAHRPWTSLRWLSLAHNEIGERGVRALIEATVQDRGSLRNLEFVDLHNNPVNPVDELVYDQDMVVDWQATAWGRRFPQVPWLRHQVLAGQLIYPRRFGSGALNVPEPELVEA